MKDIIVSIFVVLLAIAAVVGSILCGINVLKEIFVEATGGGDWTTAITGFSLALGGSLAAQILAKFVAGD